MIRALESLAASQATLARIESARFEKESAVRVPRKTEFAPLDIASVNRRWRAETGQAEDDEGIAEGQ
jgi:hypothetical protein